MTQSLHFWSNFDSPFWPEDGQNQKKKKSIREKLWPSVYPNIEKAKLYLLSHLREKYNYFFPCLGYFWLEKRRGQAFKSQNQNLIYPIGVLQFLDNLI